MEGLIGVTGDRAEAPEGAGGGGLVGERFVGEATVKEERLRDNAAVFEFGVGFVGGRSVRPCW